jgi:hypothetical protein
MHGRQFDEILKILATSKSRRCVLRGTGGGLLAGMGLRAGSVDAVPSCREEGHPCQGNGECCPGLVCRVTGPGIAKRCAAPPKSGKEGFGLEGFGPVTDHGIPPLGPAAISLSSLGIGAMRAFIRPDERPSASASVIRDNHVPANDGTRPA